MPVSVNQLIADSIIEFHKKNSDSSLQIINKMPPENLLIKVNSDLMKTCFLSIIENSSKFAGDNAHLAISANISDGTISLKFCDNGPGFSNSAIDHLFELFSAGDILHTEGTGLGLATAKLILDAHEGSIDVKNAEPGGAEVNIKLKCSSE